MGASRFGRAVAVGIVVGAMLASAGAAEAPGSAAEPQERISTPQAAILGVVQGLTEYLPVSSTGHLILANYAMHQSHFSGERPGEQAKVGPLGPVIVKNPAVDAFDVVLHLGTFLAVVGLYRRRVRQMALGLVGRDAGGARLLWAIAVAFIPAAASGLLFSRWITENLYNPLTVAGALAVGGILMIVIEHLFWRRRRDVQRVNDVSGVALWQAAVIGAAQCLALWPGTSRSMITILAALVVGLDMVAAAEFSFLLALPTLAAATAYEGLKHWSELTQCVGLEGMILALLVTAVVAALAMKGLVKWLTTHGLLPFGIYRIALAAAVYAYFAM